MRTFLDGESTFCVIAFLCLAEVLQGVILLDLPVWLPVT